jgi:MFS family permease
MISVQARARAIIAEYPPQVRLVLVQSMLFGLALNIADLLFNFYLVSLGYAADTAGLMSTVNRSAGMLFGLPLGMLIDRIGARRSLITGLSGFAAGWVVLLMVQSLMAMILAQFAIGVAFTLTMVSVGPLLAAVTSDERRATAFSTNASAILVVGFFGSMLAGILPTITGAWLDVDPRDSAAYGLALGAVVLLALAAILPVLKLDPVTNTEVVAATSVGNALKPVHVGRYLRFAVVSFLLGFGGGAILPFQNLFFRQQFGLGDAAVGAILATTALAMGLGALLGAPISRKFGLQAAATWLRWGTVPAVLLMLVPLPAVAVLAFFARGLFMAASFPLYDALIMQATPERQRGFAFSMLNVFWSSGWALAAFIAGFAQIAWGFGPVFLAAALCYGLSAIAIAKLRF